MVLLIVVTVPSAGATHLLGGYLLNEDMYKGIPLVTFSSFDKAHTDCFQPRVPPVPRHQGTRGTEGAQCPFPAALPLFLAIKMSLFRMDSSGVSKEQNVPRPLTLLMNWGYRACKGGRQGYFRACHLPASQLRGCASSSTAQGPALGLCVGSGPGDIPPWASNPAQPFSHSATLGESLKWLVTQFPLL